MVMDQVKKKIKKFQLIFCDGIVSPANALKEYKSIFTNKLLVNGTILAITCCTSRDKRDKWHLERLNSKFSNLALKNDYKLRKINLSGPKKRYYTKNLLLRIPLKSESKFKKILDNNSNMTDNAAYSERGKNGKIINKAGRTFTFFYTVKDLRSL